MEALNNIACWA